MKNRLSNAVCHVGEWLLVVLFFVAALIEVTTPNPITNGVLGFLLSEPIILVIYATWFALMAFGLAYSKIRKKKRLHKYSLMAMYLTTIYTFVLALAGGAGMESLLDDVIIGIIAAACWMRWKLRTEYINPRKFYDVVWELREDTPDH